MNVRNHNKDGLSLVEVAIIVATVVLLGAFLLPALARAKGPRGRSGCLANLKQLGLAYRLFSNDHGDQFPFALYNELGGTLDFTNSPQVSRHFETLSNELVTPSCSCVREIREEPGPPIFTNWPTPTSVTSSDLMRMKQSPTFCSAATEISRAVN